MYFVLKGTVKTISGDHFINKTFMEGTYFGEQDIVANIVNIIYYKNRISEMNQLLQQKNVNY